MNFKSCGHNRPSFRPECPLNVLQEIKMSFFLFIYFFCRMAEHTHVRGYRKYFGNRFADLSPATTTEDQIRDLYNDWANKYDEVG